MFEFELEESEVDALGKLVIFDSNPELSNKRIKELAKADSVKKLRERKRGLNCH
jgi:hypothetical protein